MAAVQEKDFICDSAVTDPKRDRTSAPPWQPDPKPTLDFVALDQDENRSGKFPKEFRCNRA
jgi:aromatic ring hydroxylase